MDFKTIKVWRKSGVHNGDELKFEYKVNINQDGIFTAYLPENIVSLFEENGIVLHQNPARRSRVGFFQSETMGGLKTEIGSVLDEYFSREEIENKRIIRYNIQTTCTYGINASGEVTPNCSPEWSVGGEDLGWKRGTVDIDSSHPKPYGILVYARPYRKQVFKYKSGKEHIEYTQLHGNGLEDDGCYLYQLAYFASMKPPGTYYEEDSLQELDYTEDVAEFFVNLLKSICKLNERIKDLLTPESILELIKTKQKLLA